MAFILFCLSTGLFYISAAGKQEYNAGKRELLKRSNIWGGSWKRKLEKGGVFQENRKIVPALVGCGEECMT